MKKLVFFLLVFSLNAWAQMALPVQQSVLPKNSLVLDYNFSNASSYTRDATSVTNIASKTSGNGTLVNSPSFINSLGYIALNGTDQYVVTPNIRPYFKSVNSSVQKSFTMSMWVFPTQLNGVIVSELNSQTPGSGWHASNIEIVNGVFKFRVWSSGTAISSSSVSLNQWYHLVLVYDGTTSKAYLNGILQGTQAIDREIPTTAQHYAIAAPEPTNMGSSGYGGFNLAQFKIHQLPLTDSDILQEYETRKSEFDYVIHSPSTNSNPIYWTVSSAWNSSTGGTGASDAFAAGHYNPWLNSTLGWAAQANNTSQFITLSYDSPALLKGIVTQGRAYNGNQWVKQATIETSMTGAAPWTNVWTNKALHTNSTNDLLTLFSTPIFAKAVRISPTDWNNHITLRMGLVVKKNDFISDNLVLHFNPAMTESYSGSGTTLIDLAGNGLNGTASNLTYSTPSFTYNGSSSQVSIADNAILEPGTGDWTIETWIRPTQFTASSQTVLGKYNNGGLTAGISYAIRVYDGSIIANFSNGSTGFLSDYYLLTLNNWVQMVYVWDKANNNLYTYVNGELKHTKALTISSILNSTTNLYLGSYNGGEYPQYFKGQIGVVRLYKKALIASEVLKNFNANKALYGL